MASLYDFLSPAQPSRMGMIEGDPEYDPWSMQAARTRARYPTRLPDPASLAASQGAVGFSDLPGYAEARRQAGNVYAGEDYNPASLLQMAVGAVGAPGMVGGVPAGALGSGVGRAKAVMRPPAVATPDVPPIRAYHGSPYDFERFDLSKIGTGEGAQAYGHGLYFAENPATAQSYRDTLASYKGKLPDDVISLPPEMRRAVQMHASGDAPAADAAKRVQWMSPPFRTVEIPKIADMIDRVRAARQGRMYEVNIRAQPEQFLDWDKLLAQQSEAVRDVLHRVGRNPDTALNRVADEMKGMEFYNALASRSAPRMDPLNIVGIDKPAATTALRSAGIPGIKYLDQGSRGGGQGTSNYVLFRDDIIDIVRKYGWAGLAAFGISEEQAKEAGVDKPKTRIGNKSYEM